MVAATAPVLAQLLDHLGAAGLALRRPQQGDVHADVPALQAQAGHVVGGEAVQGAHQHRQQGDVLVGVVDHPQQGEHDALSPPPGKKPPRPRWPRAGTPRAWSSWA